jgi:exodeoxyribonuclease VII large subunit
VARGYSILTDAQGTLVRSIAQVQQGDPVSAQLGDGTLKLRVE